MQKVSNTKITMTRGDTCKIQLFLSNDNGEPYTPDENDVIRFAAKSSYSDQEPVIYITIPNDTLLLEIRPEDTKELPFGTYVYDMQITFADGSIDTFITKGMLKIEEEVD